MNGLGTRLVSRSQRPVTDYEVSRLLQTGNSKINQSAHVHKACGLLQKKHGRGLLQKGAGWDQKLVIKFVWP